MLISPTAACHSGKQGVQESNPQPAVLETAALPIELTPYKTTLYFSSACLAVQPVLPASGAILLHFQTIGVIAPVFFTGVVALFTLGTSERNE